MKLSAIKKDILSKSKVGVANTEKKIYDKFKEKTDNFYGEYQPVEYIRLDELRSSLRHFNSGLSAVVSFTGDMSHPRPLVQGQSGDWHVALWDEGKILESAMHGSHGGYTRGTKIWDEGLSELGNIELKLVHELRAAGLPLH